MRILHLLDHSLPLHSGYSFRTRALVQEQQRRGWETVQMTTPRHSRSGPNPEQADGLTFFRSDSVTETRPVLRELREIAATRRALSQLIARQRPDIIHAHSPVLTALAALGPAGGAGIPLVYEIRAFWEDAAVGNGTGREGSLRYRATRALETYACQQVDAVGAICRGLVDDLAGRGVAREKLFEVPNGVDLAQFGEPLPRDDALGHRLGIEPDAPVLGFIGSFYDYEGLDTLIAALPLLARAHPDIVLLLVGGGPVEAALKTQVDRLSLGERVRFTGRVPNAEVDRYYSLVDVLVYPRKRMRLTELVTPLKPLEAMAQGKLVAASDVGGHRELIEDGVTGALFEADNPSALAAALAAMLAEPARWPERRATARAWVARARSWARSVDAYEPVYRRLLARGGRPA